MASLNYAKAICALASLLCLASFVSVRLSRAEVPAAQTKDTHASDSSEADRCIECHEKEVNGFARSKMAYSMRVAAQESEGTVRVPGTSIRMYSNKEGAWQSLESQGHTESYRVGYVIGSGTHASGYIVSLADHLFQSPVAYYNRRSAYGLAPGYENESDPDFTRPIQPGCLFCHAGSFSQVTGTQNEYAPRPFVHLAIGCIRCHGPADAHLQHARASNIVNPARLEPAARDSICEQCHLRGAARVLNPGKEFADFVAGQPLESTFTIYRYTTPEGTEPKFSVISHSEQLALSRCKRMSGNAMWCGSCHDPHNEPTDAVPYYRAKCLSCHAGTRFAASHPSKKSNCIGCHMPKKEANDGGHTVFTDHRIQRTSNDKPAAEPTGIVPWRDPPADLVKRNLGIASVEAGTEAKSWSQIVGGYRILTEVQHQFPDDREMYRAIGTALFVGKQYSEAAIAYELALRADPKSSPLESSLGSAYAGMGKDDLAQQHFERALELDPLNLSAGEKLIGLYEKAGETAKADAIRRKIGAFFQ